VDRVDPRTQQSSTKEVSRRTLIHKLLPVSFVVGFSDALVTQIFQFRLTAKRSLLLAPFRSTNRPNLILLLTCLDQKTTVL
jgi:hypothetical protein